MLAMTINTICHQVKWKFKSEIDFGVEQQFTEFQKPVTTVLVPPNWIIKERKGDNYFYVRNHIIFVKKHKVLLKLS